LGVLGVLGSKDGGVLGELSSRNVGKEQLDAWMVSAMNEAAHSNFEWTSQVHDPDADVDQHQKRENVMKMVQRKITAKLKALKEEETLSRIVSNGEN
jgi:hypothetical protein